LKMEHTRVKVVSVISAQQMYDAVHLYFKVCDVAILSAAVADYRPKEAALEKIKKKEGMMTLHLEKTKDILASLGILKENQFLVGFALETENELENAKTKLKKKNLDLIVLNSLKDKGAGFGTETNKVTLIAKDNKVIPFPVKTKKEVANDILTYIIDQFHA